MQRPATFDEFLKIDIRVGRVLEAVPHDGARHPAYRMRIDFGPDLGVRGSSAQLNALYSVEQLVGREVLAVVNFGPKRIAGFSSEVLVLGVPDETGRVVLLQPERDVPLGGRLF